MGQKFCNILFMWSTILQLRMPSSPDTFRVLLARFAELVKMTNHTGQWDAGFAWYSPSATHRICWVPDGDKLHWMVGYRALLILSVRYSPHLLRSWRWQTTLNWDAELAWYPPSATRRICWGREGDKLHWIVRYGALLILSECYSPNLLRSWRWQTPLDCEIWSSPRTLWVLLAGFDLDHGFRMHCLKPIRPCLIVEVQATQAKFLQPFGLCTVINCTVITFHTTNVFSCFRDVMAQFELVKHKFPN